MTRFAIGLAAGFLSLVAGVSAQQPNVLLIVSDDLTAEALSIYGNTEVHTPNLDRLAQRGMVFDRAYCQYPVCAASRASFLSGVYPPRAQVGGSFTNLSAALGNHPTLPQHFKDEGYTSSRVSKLYHMRVPGDITAGVAGPDHAPSWSRTFNVLAPEWRTPGPAGHYTNETLNFSPTLHYNLGFGAAFYTVRSQTNGAEQADWIAADQAVAQLAGFASTGEPFFLGVGFVRPHVPLVAPEAEFQRYDPAQLSLAASVPNDLADVPAQGIFWNEPSRGPNSDPDRREVLRAYYASVTFMDAQLGKLLDELDATGLAANTIVAFTSDHGYHLGEHTFWQKLSLHEESARVPLVVAGPGVQAGRSGALVELLDLYPTFCDMAGLATPPGCQGASLAGLFAGGTTPVRSAAFSMVSNGWLLRTEDWAYMQYSGGGEELYDMVGDPLQFTNRIGDPSVAAVEQQLRAALAAKRVVIAGEAGVGYCFGDVNGGLCPCLNYGNPGEGCANSTGAGAALVGGGLPDVTSDTFSQSVAGAPAGQAGFLFHGLTPTGTLLGDGVLCVTLTQRYPVVSVGAAGDVRYADLGGLAMPGSTHYYQFVYRDASACGGGFNFSNAWQVTWR